MSSKRIREYPPNPNTTRGTSTKLGSSGDKIIYANGKSIVVRGTSSVFLFTVLKTDFCLILDQRLVCQFPPFTLRALL